MISSSVYFFLKCNKTLLMFVVLFCSFLLFLIFNSNKQSEYNKYFSAMSNYKTTECYGLEHVTEKTSFFDIILITSNCIEQKNVDNLIKNYLVAHAYYKFDSERVLDSSLRDNIPQILFLQLSYMFDSYNTSEFNDYVKKNDFWKNSKTNNGLCSSLKKLKAPTYNTYQGVVSPSTYKLDFDGEKVWANVIATSCY